MGCRGCGGRPAKARRPARPVREPGTLVLARYTGSRTELFSVRGPVTGTKYLFSACETENVQPVWSGDLALLTKSGLEYAGDLDA